MIKLYGTLTSPYVRRVRVVAQELALPYELIDVFTDEGQAALRAVCPLWKVPMAEVEGQVVFDSREIIDHLLRGHGSRHGSGSLVRVDPADVDTRNILTVIDGVLDALINSFYLARDGLQRNNSSYIAKQHDRAAASMAWLEARVDNVWLTGTHAFGLPEIALCTTLGWMRLRQTYPIERHPALVRCFEHHDARESLASTRPPG